MRSSSWHPQRRVHRLLDTATFLYLQDVVRARQGECLDPEREGCRANGTRKLRSIFEVGPETTPPLKASGTAPEILSPSGDTTKPMSNSALRAEKSSSGSKVNSPPGPKIAVSRATTCNGQEAPSTIGRSVSDDHKVAAFDGLLQYLQDCKHGLRELLVNNNVVIIEPVRQSAAIFQERKSASESTCRITGATVKKNRDTSASNTLPRQQPILRRHFFYHPVRSNRELVDEELPDPDKVRHAREMFERTVKIQDTRKGDLSNANVAIRSSAAKTTETSKSEDKIKRRYLTVDTVFRHDALQKRWTDSGSLSSGVSSDLSCCETDVESADALSRREDAFSDDNDEGHYVPPEVLERIRACGTTVTYYGGQVISASDGPVRSPITLAIMDEIQRSKGQGDRLTREQCLGVKFRLVKSNSCGSRLELAGTEDEQNAPDETRNEDQVRENGHRSSTTARWDGESIPDQANTYDRVMCFSPEKSKRLERGSKTFFDDMEFEEFEIAEDSLNVIEEQDIECDSSDEDGVRKSDLRGGRDVDVPVGKQEPNDSEETLQRSTSRAKDDVQMTTWASRSASSENGGCPSTQMSWPNHTSC